MTSPIGRSALDCGLRFKFDIGRLLDPRFDYCNLVWNNYLSNVSAKLLANVSVLKDFLLSRDKPELCSDMDIDIDAASRQIFWCQSHCLYMTAAVSPRNSDSGLAH